MARWCDGYRIYDDRGYKGGGGNYGSHGGGGYKRSSLDYRDGGDLLD